MHAEDEDLFEGVHHAEEEDIQKGYTDGVRDGMVAGIHEGRELGLQKGYEIGAELGFYAGCVRTWRALQAYERQGSQSIPPLAELASLALTSSTQPSASTQPATTPAAASTGASPSNAASAGSAANSIPDAASSSTDQASASIRESMLVPARAEKALAGLEELLQEFPSHNPQDERLHDLLERIRGRFKVVATMLGLLHDYQPREVDKRSASQTGGTGTGATSGLSF